MSSYVIPRLSALTRAEEVINHVAANCKSFKIGKTHDLVERISEPDYKGVYPNCDFLYKSKSKVLASYVEALCIDACMEYLSGICDNKIDGNQSLNDEMPDSEWYTVYIVWR